MQNTNNETVYRQKLKGRILKVAATLFHQHGIKQVKMDDIASDLKISKRTLYEIYETKEDLLFEVLQRREDMERQQVIEFDKPGTNVINIILRSIGFEHQSLSRLILSSLKTFRNILIC